MTIQDALDILGDITRSDSDRAWVNLDDEKINMLKQYFSPKEKLTAYRGSTRKLENISFWTRNEKIAKAYSTKISKRVFSPNEIIYDSYMLRESGYWEQFNGSMINEIVRLQGHKLSDTKIKKILGLKYYDRNNLEGTCDLEEIIVRLE